MTQSAIHLAVVIMSQLPDSPVEALAILDKAKELIAFAYARMAPPPDEERIVVPFPGADRTSVS